MLRIKSTNALRVKPFKGPLTLSDVKVFKPGLSLSLGPRKDHTSMIVTRFLSCIGTKVSETVKDSFYRSHDDLLAIGISPQDYTDGYEFKHDYAAVKLLSKSSFLKLSVNPEEAALKTALESENACLRTNEDLLDYTYGVVKPHHALAIQRARDCLYKILGELRLADIFDDIGWSKGRTSSSYGEFRHSIDKYGSSLDCTQSALPYAWAMVNSSPHWAATVLDADAPCSVLINEFTIKDGNTMICVPKNAKTHRTISYEPHLNIYLQLAVGRYIRKRLMRFGVNLSDQSINQRRAKLASKTGHLATIDLQSASDTLSIMTVKTLLPGNWFKLLNDLRSSSTTWPDGETRVNHKFSSMGNGFTFELESAIFYALCSSVATDVSVYGDDIIVPTSSYDDVRSILTLFGFKLNGAKSFVTGPFRESCGFDAFLGQRVTPIYLKSKLDCLTEIIKFHNSVRRWATCSLGTVERKWLDFCNWIRNTFPGPLGASGLGDGHYHVNLDEGSFTRAPGFADAWTFTSIVPFFAPRGDVWDGNELRSDLYHASLCVALGHSDFKLGTSSDAPGLEKSLIKSGLGISRLRTVRIWSGSSWPDVIAIN